MTPTTRTTKGEFEIARRIDCPHGRGDPRCRAHSAFQVQSGRLTGDRVGLPRAGCRHRLEKTSDAIMEGLGDIMAEIGLLIAFGVLMGSILQRTGAIQRLVETLLKVFGAKRMPYADHHDLSAVN